MWCLKWNLSTYKCEIVHVPTLILDAMVLGSFPTSWLVELCACLKLGVVKSCGHQTQKEQLYLFSLWRQNVKSPPLKQAGSTGLWIKCKSTVCNVHCHLPVISVHGWETASWEMPHNLTSTCRKCNYIQGKYVLPVQCVKLLTCPYRTLPLLEWSCSSEDQSSPVCSWLGSDPLSSPPDAGFVRLLPDWAAESFSK